MTLKIKMSNEDKDKFLHNLTEILEEVIKTEYYQTIDYNFSRGSRVYVFTNDTAVVYYNWRRVSKINPWYWVLRLFALV